MFSHSTNTAWFFSVLMAALIFSLSLAGVWRRRRPTPVSGDRGAVKNNTTGAFNTASRGQCAL